MANGRCGPAISRRFHRRRQRALRWVRGAHRRSWLRGARSPVIRARLARRGRQGRVGQRRWAFGCRGLGRRRRCRLLHGAGGWGGRATERTKPAQDRDAQGRTQPAPQGPSLAGSHGQVLGIGPTFTAQASGRSPDSAEAAADDARVARRAARPARPDQVAAPPPAPVEESVPGRLPVLSSAGARPVRGPGRLPAPPGRAAAPRASRWSARSGAGTPAAPPPA